MRIPTPHSRLFRVGAVLVSRGAGSLLQFGLNLALGRTIGAAGLGVYYLFFSWTRLGGAATNLGLPPYALREVSKLFDGERRGAARTLVRRSLLWAGVAGVLAAAAFALTPDTVLIRLANLGDAAGIAAILRLAVLAGAIYALLRILVETLKAIDLASVALNLEFSLVPAGLLILVIVAGSTSLELSASGVVVAHTALLLLATLVAARIVWRTLRGAGEGSDTGSTDTAPIERRNAATFWLLGFNNIAFSTFPIILMPRFVGTADEVGQFGLAVRLVGLAATILAALASVYSPRFARQHARGAFGELRRSLLASQLYSVLIFLPLFVAFMVFGGPILSIFGPDFVAGRIYLTIMAVGQLINSATGLSGQLLNMTGRESAALTISVLSTVLMMASIYLLGSVWGGIGVAFAAAGSVAFRNVAFLIVGLVGVVRYTSHSSS